MTCLRIWNGVNEDWIGVGVEKAFSTIKVNNVFIDADIQHDTLQILGGDNINVLPDETFTSVVITTTGIGDPSTLTTTATLVVDAINELNTLSGDNQTNINNHITNSDIHVTTTMKEIWDAKQDSLSGDITSHNHPHRIYDVTTLLNNGDYYGDSSIEFVNESCNIFDLLYLSPDGYMKASATSESSIQFPCVAMALTNLPNSSGGDIALLKYGYIKNTNWDFTKGQMLYLSPDDSVITETRPSNSDEIIQIIGYAVDTDIIHFNPSYIWLTV
ncbi:MAG: hypothetical protein ACOCP8_01825 [archaeon]